MDFRWQNPRLDISQFVNFVRKLVHLSYQAHNIPQYTSYISIIAIVFWQILIWNSSCLIYYWLLYCRVLQAGIMWSQSVCRRKEFEKEYVTPLKYSLKPFSLQWRMNYCSWKIFYQRTLPTSQLVRPVPRERTWEITLSVFLYCTLL